MQEPPSADTRRDGLSNILKNFAWLLGGKGFAAVCSIIYLAVLSRSLGVRDFGHFSLIFGTGQALVAVAGFQTWQTMVRFGAKAGVEKDWDRFGRLAFMCGAIDVSGAMVGTVLAAIVYYGFGELLDLNQKYVNMAFAFNCALLWARLTTPNGIVRVLDRFDIGAYCEAVVPVGRLLASGVILLAGATVGRFLFAWAFFDLLAAAIYWFAAWRLVPQAMHWRNFGRWRQTLDENPGLTRFFGITYGNSTLDSFYKQGPLLAIGFFIGTTTAGLYRLADQMAQSIGKFAALVARAVFPEFVHAQTGMDAPTFRRLFRQVTVFAGIGGIMVIALALLLGEDILALVGGPDFAKGAGILVALAIGASFELASVSYEPMLYATGHPRYPLIARSISVMALLAGIFAFADQGPQSVAWVVASGLAICYVVMSVFVFFVLREVDRKGRLAPESDV